MLRISAIQSTGLVRHPLDIVLDKPDVGRNCGDALASLLTELVQDLYGRADVISLVNSYLQMNTLPFLFVSFGFVFLIAVLVIPPASVAVQINQ